MAEHNSDQSYENRAYQTDEKNPYEVLENEDAERYISIKNIKATPKDFGRDVEEKPQKSKISANRACIIFVIFLGFVSTVGFVTMTLLFLREKNKNDGNPQNISIYSYVLEVKTLKRFNKEFLDSSGKVTLQYLIKDKLCLDEKSNLLRTNNPLGSRGRSFLVSFIQNHIEVNETNRKILVSSENDFNMTVTLSDSRSPNLLTTSTHRTENRTLKKISVHYSMIPAYSLIEPKAIRITTSALTTVLILDEGEYTSDSTIVFPIDKLSKYYIISTAPPTGEFLDSGSHFTIAATTDNTHISIVFAIDHNTSISLHDKEFGNGDTFTVILNNFQTFQIGQHADLSGTTINSSQPIAVFAGNRCNNIGYHGACSIQMEMIPPVDEFDDVFIVPPSINRYQSLIRIIAPFQTKVTYTFGGMETTTTLLKSRYTDFTTRENEISLIQSAKPVLVNVFAAGATNSQVYGDPYMMTVPGINQYLNQYIVDVPEGYNFSFATFIIRNESLFNLQINNTRIDNYATVFHSTITVGPFLFGVMTVNVPSGVIQVESTDGSLFGMLIYGQRRFDGHGYAANALLTSICRK